MSDEPSLLTEVPRDQAGLFGRVLDLALPDEVRRNPEEARRGRLYLVVQVLLSAAAFFFAWQSMGTTGRLEGPSLVLFCGGAISFINYPILRWRKDVRIPGVILTIQDIMVVWLCGWLGHGVGDASQSFILTAPVLAAFIVGPRWGYISAGLVIGGTIFTFFGESFGHTFTPPNQAEDAWFFAAATVTVAIVLTSVAYMYEDTRRANMALVNSAIAELKRKNLEMVHVNSELAHRRDAAVAEAARKDTFLRQMRSFSETQGQGLERTRHATSQLAETIRAIAASVETLASTTSSSDARLRGMSDSATEVRDVVESLLNGVEETSTALFQLTSAVSEVQKQFVALARSAESTTHAMVAMEESAGRVESGATHTAALSDAMIKDAERGQEAVKRTLWGIGEIRASSRLVDEAIRTLSQRLLTVSKMNNLIEEVAVETNVLALNASIIAAQAGAHGQGFAVVADQIKALAGRTAKSTREITTVIQSVDEDARNAVDAIERGTQAVDAGVAMSSDAARALELIVASARAATQHVKDIEVATVEQARRARAVGEAMSSVTHLVALAQDATREHTKASSLIDRAMDWLRLLGPDLEARSKAQVEGAQDARSALQRISDMAMKLSTVQSAQTRASDQTVRAVEEIHRAQVGQFEALQGLDAAPKPPTQPPRRASEA